jgi:ribonuclease BN (tRNA processing enzyme)
VKLRVIGCSPAWPNPGGAHSGYLVEGRSGRLLLDCGPGVLPRLRELSPWPDVDAIVITHFHLDHWGDLIPWVWGSMHHRIPHGRPEVWVYRGGRAKLEQFGEGLGFPDMFERVFKMEEYDEGVPFETAGFTLTATRLPHYTIETYGFRVAADGATLAYSGDSGPSERLAELARDADLFLCEATLLHGEDDGQPRGHLSVDEAMEAAAGARRVLLTHRPFELPRPHGVDLAYDGLVVEIP